MSRFRFVAAACDLAEGIHAAFCRATEEPVTRFQDLPVPTKALLVEMATDILLDLDTATTTDYEDLASVVNRRVTTRRVIVNIDERRSRS